MHASLPLSTLVHDSRHLNHLPCMSCAYPMACRSVMLARSPPIARNTQRPCIRWSLPRLCACTAGSRLSRYDGCTGLSRRYFTLTLVPVCPLLLIFSQSFDSHAATLEAVSAVALLALTGIAGPEAQHPAMARWSVHKSGPRPRVPLRAGLHIFLPLATLLPFPATRCYAEAHRCLSLSCLLPLAAT